MGYRVGLTNKKKDGSRGWKIYYLEGTKYRLLSDDELHVIGINKSFTYEQVKASVRTLNKDGHSKRVEKLRQASMVRKYQSDQAVVHYLPKAFLDEFEAHLKTNEGATAQRYWPAAKACIIELKCGVEHLWKEPRKVYKYFAEKQYALSYSKKIILLLNLYGTWWSRKTEKAYHPVPSPKGVEREKINDAYFDSGKTDKESDPLTPEMLLKAKNQLSDNAYNWLFISIWFGLRPEEVDKLHNDASWEIIKEGDLNVLAVFQTKLTSIARDKRWKYIPILFPEQEKAVELIKSKNFKRPLVKTLRRHIDPKVSNYGGRKGFVELMISKGRSFVEIQSWMGHQNIDRTWKSYKNKKKVFIER